MVRRNRPSQVKREREQRKRERQQKKADKAALKRERRFATGDEETPQAVEPDAPAMLPPGDRPVETQE